MSSFPVRDPLQDALLNPGNSALIIIDYQPVQVTSVASMDRRDLVANIVAVAKAAKLFKLPVVLSTVEDVKNGPQPNFQQFPSCAKFCPKKMKSIALQLTPGRIKSFQKR